MFSLLFYISSESSLMFKILKNCLKSFISFIWNKFSNAFEEMKFFVFFYWNEERLGKCILEFRFVHKLKNLAKWISRSGKGPRDIMLWIRDLDFHSFPICFTKSKLCNWFYLWILKFIPLKSCKWLWSLSNELKKRSLYNF